MRGGEENRGEKLAGIDEVKGGSDGRGERGGRQG